MYTERVALMVPWPKEESPIVAPIRPFQSEVFFYYRRGLQIRFLCHIVAPKVWIWLPISIVAVSLTLFLIQKYYKKNNGFGISPTLAVSKLYNFFVYVIAGEGISILIGKLFGGFHPKLKFLFQGIGLAGVSFLFDLFRGLGAWLHLC